MLLKFAWFWPSGALSLGPHGGHRYHMNDFESPAPKDESCQVWLKSDHAFSRSKWNSYFLHRAPTPTRYPPPPPPPTGAIGATLGTAMNKLYSSPKKVSTHYITWLNILLLDLEEFEICMVLPLRGTPPRPPWGPHVPYEQLWIPGP